MKMTVINKEVKHDKFNREYIALTFENQITGKVWNFWLWSWLKDYHTSEVYSTGYALITGDSVDVLWKRAAYRGSDLQIITSLTHGDWGNFEWKD